MDNIVFNKDKIVLLNPVLAANKMLPGEDIHSLLEKRGGNTGNIVFVNAIKEQILFDEESWFHEGMDEQSVYIVPCSSFLHAANKWIEKLTDILEHTHARVILVGLGAQAHFGDTVNKTIRHLSHKQVRFFQIIGERTKSIGVRGEFTAECLNALGIKNSRVIGCPSVFLYLDGCFREIKGKGTKRSILTLTPGRNAYPQKLLQIGIKMKSTWIMQEERELYTTYRGAGGWIKKELFFPGVDMRVLQRYQKSGTMLFDFHEWNRFLLDGRYDFAFGTRFHGNMMCLRNGIPTLWLVHDMRTWELTEYLRLPHLDIRAIQEDMDAQKLMDLCDYDDFMKRYPVTFKNYCDFLVENGIVIRKGQASGTKEENSSLSSYVGD